MALVEIKHLKKYYNTPRGLLHAIDDVTMDIEKGKTIGIVGESGCGKSTLGKTLIRMEDATDGEVYFDGKEVTHMSQHEFKNMRMRMQMIFQDPYASLDPRMSVSQLIAEPIQTYHLAKNKKELDEIVERSLQGAAIFEEVKDRLHKSALGLSGGQQQRLCIARALAVSPEVLLMDEPTSALDPISTLKIEELMETLKKKYTVVIVTHNMQQAARVSDDTAFFLVGEVIEKNATSEIFARPQDKRTEDYITGRFG